MSHGDLKIWYICSPDPAPEPPARGCKYWASVDLPNDTTCAGCKNMVGSIGLMPNQQEEEKESTD